MACSKNFDSALKLLHTPRSQEEFLLAQFLLLYDVVDVHTASGAHQQSLVLWNVKPSLVGGCSVYQSQASLP
ncbi:hypothetical protein OUZ56_002016 [Daphnia magna]|uniref:Uncharacterized protein n=1 Tax=Daphnia magna TaxID=35525 RepID=A0ABR0A4V8_9CRUS|nr:hypothetical protein OUZ56_002016 [Daphnia magna]